MLTKSVKRMQVFAVGKESVLFWFEKCWLSLYFFLLR